MAKGLTLTFHLAGINNQNFLMRDEETGTFWQQISGRAISGPLTGSQLDLVYSDELTFALWRNETKDGSVLKPVARYAEDYAPKDWDTKMKKAPTVLDFPKSGMKSRELVLGMNVFGARRAYPVEKILREKLIQDRIGGEPVLLVVGPDGKSIRVFRARFHSNEGAAPDYYRLGSSLEAAADAPLFLDSATGSEWNFAGCAVKGKLIGSCLEPIWAIKDYWFDWRNYHPDTTVFRH
jgi:hypothetical protein